MKFSKSKAASIAVGLILQPSPAGAEKKIPTYAELKSDPVYGCQVIRTINPNLVRERCFTRADAEVIVLHCERVNCLDQSIPLTTQASQWWSGLRPPKISDHADASNAAAWVGALLSVYPAMELAHSASAKSVGKQAQQLVEGVGAQIIDEEVKNKHLDDDLLKSNPTMKLMDILNMYGKNVKDTDSIMEK